MTLFSFWRPLAAALLSSVALAAQAQSTPAAREPIRLAFIEGLSGPFANAGESVHRNLLWAVERVNQRGGIPLPGGARPLELVRYDSKGQAEEALTLLRAALDRHLQQPRRTAAVHSNVAASATAANQRGALGDR